MNGEAAIGYPLRTHHFHRLPARRHRRRRVISLRKIRRRLQRPAPRGVLRVRPELLGSAVRLAQQPGCRLGDDVAIGLSRQAPNRVGLLAHTSGIGTWRLLREGQSPGEIATRARTWFTCRVPGSKMAVLGAAIAVAVVATVAWGPVGGSTRNHLLMTYARHATIRAGPVCLTASARGLIQYAQRDGWMNTWTHATVVSSSVDVRAFRPDCTTPLKATFSDFDVVRSDSHCTWMTHLTCGGRLADRYVQPFGYPVKTAIVGIDTGNPVPLSAGNYIGSAPSACLHVATWVAGTTGTRPFNGSFDLAACTPRP